MWGCSADALAPAEGAPMTMSAVDSGHNPAANVQESASVRAP